MRFGMTEADAADATQEVLLLTIRTLPSFEYDKSRCFRAWLKTVLANVWRKQQRTKSRASAPNADAEQAIASPEGDPFDEVEHRDYLVRRALQIAEKDFEPTTWKACVEFVMKGRPAADVARELGITVNAVYIAKSRVMRHLRAELDGMLD
jgi:RNA polymerase sigma-70 factor (ECF subfamily)